MQDLHPKTGGVQEKTVEYLYGACISKTQTQATLLEYPQSFQTLFFMSTVNRTMNLLEPIHRSFLKVGAFTDHALRDPFQNISPYANFQYDMKFYSQVIR